MIRIRTITLLLLLLLPNGYGIIAEDSQPDTKKSIQDDKIAEYRQKLADKPNDIELHRSYQNFARQSGGLNDLKEEYLLKLNAEPQNPVLYYLYGRLTEGKELEDSFKRALELEAKTTNPQLRFWLYFGFGQFYLDSKKYKESLQYLELAAKLKPESLDVLHQTALVYYEMDNITEAMKLWDNILQTKNDYLDAMLGKALIYKSRGMFDNAIKELENTLKIDVAFWRAYEPLIQCYHAKEDYKKGEELRNKIRSLHLSSNIPSKIIIDIVQVKEGFCIVNENIEKIDVLVEEYILFNFELYIKKTDKNPEIFYGYESCKGILFRWENPEVNKDGSLIESPKEIVSEKKLNYPELIKMVLEREK